MIKTTYIGALRSIYSTLLHEYQGDGSEILKKHHLSQDHLYDLTGRMPMELMTSIWDDCRRMTGDHLFGIKASSHANTVNLYGIDRLLLVAPSIGYGLELYPYLMRLLHLDFNIRVSTDLKGNLIHELQGPAASAHASLTARAYSMGLHLKVFESIFGLPIKDCIENVAVTVRNAAVLDWLDEKCGGKVLPSELASITFKRELLEVSSKSSNSRLFRHLERLFLQALAREEQPLPFISLVNQLSNRLGDYQDLQGLGKYLGISQYYVHKSLELAGETVFSLHDKARKSAAARLVEGGVLSVKQIADLCGYASSTSFIRAFDRWYGCTPRLYKESGCQPYQRLKALA